MDIQKLQNAFEKAGFTVATPEEFDAWLEASDKYHKENWMKYAVDELMTDYFLATEKEYVFTDEMGEISGFGGGYEKGCRAMVVAGLRWMRDNPDAEPHYRGYEGIYGVLSDDNDDANALSKAVTSVASGCTGAMHQATIGHVLWINKNGWDKYVEKMTEEEPND